MEIGLLANKRFDQRAQERRMGRLVVFEAGLVRSGKLERDASLRELALLGLAEAQVDVDLVDRTACFRQRRLSGRTPEKKTKKQ